MREALQRAGIAWRDDGSNEDRRFARNRVRLDLLPAFRSLHPAAEANLLRTAELLAEDDAALDALAAGCSAATAASSTAAVAAAPRRAAAGAAARAGFPAPRPVAAERVAALARARSGAGSVPLGAGRFAERRYDRIAIVPAGPPPQPAREVALAVPGDTVYGDALVHCALARGGGRARRRARARRSSCARRAPGERLPGARRTIARMLLEARVPRSERARYPVVSAHGEPVALPGIAVAPALRRPSGLVLTLAAT